MNIKSDSQTLASLTIFGLIAFTIIKYSQVALGHIISTIGILLNVDVAIYSYLDFIPQILIIVVWAFLVFKYLDKFSGEIKIEPNKHRRLAIRLATAALLLFFGSTLLMIGKDFVIASYSSSEYLLNGDIIRRNSMIYTFLNSVEFILIVIGFFRILGSKKTTANMV